MIWGLILSLIKHTLIFDDMTLEKFLFYYWRYTSTYLQNMSTFRLVIVQKYELIKKSLKWTWRENSKNKQTNENETTIIVLVSAKK